MRLARYIGQGRVAVEEAPMPELPPGGLLVQTEASGLCSGELMHWYMEPRAPHVLGHEVAGIVVASEDNRFPIGSRVAPHHHAPCGQCDFCRSGRPVHCSVWKSTRLVPGGMAETFAVPAPNLADTHVVDDLAPEDAALMEPLATVAKSISRSRYRKGDRVAVVGLGAMGLLHMLAIGEPAVGTDINTARISWATGLGLDACAELEAGSFDLVFVCPGSQPAIQAGIDLAAPGGRVVLFAPLKPGEGMSLLLGDLYFREIELIPAYSAGPEDCWKALEWLRDGRVRAKQIVSDFVDLEALPEAYGKMKRGEILKAMVVFP